MISICLLFAVEDSSSVGWHLLKRNRNPSVIKTKGPFQKFKSEAGKKKKTQMYGYSYIFARLKWDLPYGCEEASLGGGNVCYEEG